ncbi:MAG: methyltransferase [Coxiella sp. DG_40]|nr:MAG: methyltransferase [Coxiella sp. DG_40]
MIVINLLQTNTVLFLILVGFLGLEIGSFLNVVIYRLPIMLKKQWQYESAEILKQPLPPKKETYNLAVPRSRCPHCNHSIKGIHNIPLISFILLRGKCSYCGNKISFRYPFVELICCFLSIFIAFNFGVTIKTAVLLPLTWTLIALVFIDFEHLLLPDIITLPFLWLGLLLSLFGVFCNSSEAIIGAASGYLILWLSAQAFRLIRGKEGMGRGDFKLLAMFGAWLGWQTLPFIIFFSSLLGAVIGFVLILLKKHTLQKPIPFGPYIAIAGYIAIIWGHNIFNWYLQHIIGR